MRIRPAEIGDEGVLLGSEAHGSLGTLILQLNEGEQAFLHGDWRMVAEIADTLAGERIEVIKGEGSSYGAHDLRHLECL